jgi:thymidylate kinase
LEDDGFHERVRRGFLQVARESKRHLVLDGNRDVAALADEAAAAVAQRLRAEKTA